MNGSLLSGVLALFISTPGLAQPPIDDVDSLPAYNVDASELSVSGLSSGGYMAQQFHAAYADTLIGVGVLAGGPYYCAENSVLIAVGRCMLPEEHDAPDPHRLAWLTREFAERGWIANPAAMADHRVWLFSSPEDATVRQRVMDTLVEYYRYFVADEQIVYVNDVSAAHAMVTRDWGHDCDYVGSGGNEGDVFINNCGYDAAGKLLAHLYQRLRSRVDEPAGRFIRFPQDVFIEAPRSHGMNDHGYAYVPARCDQGQKCRVHVVFHGCLQYEERIGEVFFRHAGYNQWADNNRLIVLYPQSHPTSTQSNGNGCWDWWGYDDAHYMWREGRQMQAVNAMLGRLTGGSGTVRPEPPGGVTANVQLDGSINLGWNAVDDPRVEGYIVYESTVSGGPYFESTSHMIVESRLALSGEAEETRYFVITSVGHQGVESVPTPELGVAVPGL